MTNTDNTAETRTAWQLARLAGVHDPDSPTSPGAKWLEDVASAVDDYDRDVDRRGDDDAIWELADAAVPVYTHNRWQVFVDLCAYEEDISDTGQIEGKDMTEQAGIALYMIAERLAQALIAERTDTEDEE